MFSFSDEGTITFLNPNFSHSLIRFSKLLTPLISPESPISPIITVSGLTITSLAHVATASAIPKSAAGSSIFMPPMTFT